MKPAGDALSAFCALFSSRLSHEKRAMSPRRLHVTVWYALLSTVLGYDYLEGLLQGAPCFRQAPQRQGCNATLLESFTPRSRGVGINAPATAFFLFTPRSQDAPEFLHDCGGRLPSDTTYDVRLETEIFVHGWLDGTCRTAWMREMKDQLFIRGKYNVLLVDWTWGNIPDYYDAGANTHVVAEQLEFVIRNIMDQSGAGGNKFHVIGHSFGAHIAGFASKNFRPQLRRVTGLDPALAPFQNSPPSQRLYRDNAQIVDVIHSNGGDCLVYSIGDDRAVGDADFYPNGGLVQPSCLLYGVESLLKLDALYGAISLLQPMCNHVQAIQFYKVSINPGDCDFVGVECADYVTFHSGRCHRCDKNGANCAVMGMDFERYPYPDEGEHKYYLDTRLACPYCDNSDLKLNGFPPKPRTALP